MKKYFKSTFAALLFLLAALMFITAEAYPYITSGDGFYEYEVLPDGTIRIVYCALDSDEIIIPALIDGYQVTRLSSIGYDKQNVKKIIIEEGVKTIDYMALPAKSIQEIVLPDSLECLNLGIFSYTDVKNVYIPKGVKELSGNSAIEFESFTVSEENEYLTSVDGVVFTKALDELVAYPNASGKAEYIIPNGVTAIAERAFYGCENLVSIQIPDSVTEIGSSAFAKCQNLKDVKLPPELTVINDSLFSDCKAIEEIEVPYLVSSIGQYAFSNCDSLKKLSVFSSNIVFGNIFSFSMYNSDSDITICGLPSSTAEFFANENNLNFECYLPAVTNAEYVGECEAASNVKLNKKSVRAFICGGRTLIDLYDVYINGYGFNGNFDVCNNVLSLSDTGDYFSDDYINLDIGTEQKLYTSLTRCFINGREITLYSIGGRPAVFVDELCNTENSQNAGFGFSDYIMKSDYTGEELNIYSFGNDIKGIEVDYSSVSRMKYYLFDNIIQPDYDFCYQVQNEAQPWKAYNETILNMQNQILPLYLLINDTETQIGMCCLVEDLSGFADMHYNFYDTNYVLALLSEYKTSIYIPSYDELMSYLENSFTIYGRKDSENYTVVSAAPKGYEDDNSAYSIYIVSKNGGYRQIVKEHRVQGGNIIIGDEILMIIHISTEAPCNMIWHNEYDLAELFEK